MRDEKNDQKTPSSQFFFDHPSFFSTIFKSYVNSTINSASTAFLAILSNYLKNPKTWSNPPNTALGKHSSQT